MKKGNMKISLPKPNKEKTIKVITIITSGILLTSIATVAINSFFMEHYLDFQSPIVLRSPILVQNRTDAQYISPIGVEAVSNATESAETTKEEEPIVEEVSLTPSPRLIAHSEARPDIYAKIVEHFGDESILAGELIARESSFNPLAINPTSGACGLAQALPCEKMDCDLTDVDCQLEWIGEYVENRYGNFENAIAFHDEKGWY